MHSQCKTGRGILGRTEGYCLYGRDGVSKAKVWLELNLARDPKNTKKGFHRYICQKRVKKMYYVWWTWLANWEQQTRCCCCWWFFASSLFPHLLSGARQGLREQSPSHCERGSDLRPPEEPAETCLSLWDLTRCIPKSQGDLVDVVIKPLPMVFEKSWQSREIPDEKGKHCTHLKKGRKGDPSELSASPLCLGRSWNKQILLGLKTTCWWRCPFSMQKHWTLWSLKSPFQPK